jgi:hypothetical protein
MLVNLPLDGEHHFTASVAFAIFREHPRRIQSEFDTISRNAFWAA